MFVYELSGSGVNVRYCACFEQMATWHLGNYKVHTHSKTRMWHDKSTQLKNFLLLHTVLLNYFNYIRVLRHLTFCMVKQLQLSLAGIGSNWFLLIWSEKSLMALKLFTTNQQQKSCSPNLFTILKKDFGIHLSQSEHQETIVKRLTSSLG